MNTSKSAQELSKEIEEVVERYMAEGRRAATQALEQAFGGPVTAVMRSKVAKPRAMVSSNSGYSRRTPEELAELEARLCEVVHTRPGEGMAVFAAELEMSVRALHLPMSALKRDGRVRSTGQRQRTRYFPCVSSKAAPAS